MNIKEKRENNKLILLIEGKIDSLSAPTLSEYLQKELKNCEYFRDSKFWISNLEDMIKDEKEKFDIQAAKNNLIFSEDKKKKKMEEIVFTKIASIIASLNGFELEKEKIDEIISSTITKYKLSDETINTINLLLQSK